MSIVYTVLHSIITSYGIVARALDLACSGLSLDSVLAVGANQGLNLTGYARDFCP